MTHSLHLAVHGEKVMLGDLNLDVGFFAVVGSEGVFVKPDGGRLGRVGRQLFRRSRVGRGLDGAQT